MACNRRAGDFRQLIRKLQIDDIVYIKVKRPAGILQTMVIISGYKQPMVRISEIQVITERHRNLEQQSF